MANKQHNKGFGTLGVVTAVAVVVLAGFGGWYVYQHNHASKKQAIFRRLFMRQYTTAAVIYS